MPIFHAYIRVYKIFIYAKNPIGFICSYGMHISAFIDIFKIPLIFFMLIWYAYMRIYNIDIKQIQLMSYVRFSWGFYVENRRDSYAPLTPCERTGSLLFIS